jgi:hypothetical protein
MNATELEHSRQKLLRICEAEIDLDELRLELVTELLTHTTGPWNVLISQVLARNGSLFRQRRADSKRNAGSGATAS